MPHEEMSVFWTKVGKLFQRTCQSMDPEWQKRRRVIDTRLLVVFINRETPKHLQLHLIVDNYATHKHPKVKAWLEKHKRFHMHFTPTSCSWMNMVERFFRDIRVYLCESSFSSVRELETSITTFLALRNAQPTRYVWNAKGEDILNKIQRAREAMVSQANG